MNNSFLQPEEKRDYSERAGKLATLIEAVEAILASPEWSTLKAEEFDGELERLERMLLTEAKKKPLDEAEIYILQGRIDTMKKYSLERLRNKYRIELEGINKLN